MTERRVEAVRRLLTSADPAAIRQGVALAVGISDPALIDALLDGVQAPTAVTTEITKFGRFPTPSRNKVFDKDGVEPGWLGLAMIHLIAASSHRLRTEVRSLRIGAPTSPPSGVSIPVWLDGLERLESLSHLDLWLPQHDPVDLSPLEHFPALTFLRIRGAQNPPELPPLGHLERLEVGRVRLSRDAHYPNLRSLRGWFDAPDGLDRDHLGSLIDVDARNGLEMSGFDQLGIVRLNKGAYELPGCTSIRELHAANAGSVDAPDLRSVGLLNGVPDGMNISQLDVVERVSR